jgi:hypothetical protein
MCLALTLIGQVAFLSGCAAAHDTRYAQLPWHEVRQASEYLVRRALPKTFTVTPAPLVVVLDRRGQVMEKNAAPLITRIADGETKALAPAAVMHWASRKK